MRILVLLVAIGVLGCAPMDEFYIDEFAYQDPGYVQPTSCQAAPTGRLVPTPVVNAAAVPAGQPVSQTREPELAR